MSGRSQTRNGMNGGRRIAASAALVAAGALPLGCTTEYKAKELMPMRDAGTPRDGHQARDSGQPAPEPFCEPKASYTECTLCALDSCCEEAEAYITQGQPFIDCLEACDEDDTDCVEVCVRRMPELAELTIDYLDCRDAYCESECSE